MEIRPLESLSREELLEVIKRRDGVIAILERDLHEMAAKYEAVGAGGVSLMGHVDVDGAVAELDNLIDQYQDAHYDGRTIDRVRARQAIKNYVRAALTPQEQDNGTS